MKRQSARSSTRAWSMLLASIASCSLLELGLSDRPSQDILRHSVALTPKASLADLRHLRDRAVGVLKRHADMSGYLLGSIFFVLGMITAFLWTVFTWTGLSTPTAPQVTGKYKFFVGVNWKCNVENVQETDKLVKDINNSWDSSKFVNIELCVFPPYVFLDRVRQQLSQHVHVGSQNAWDSTPGYACTGVVTAEMLQAMGCRWVMLGHSDRRLVLRETDELVAQKIVDCLGRRLCVNVTIGETQAAREKGVAIPVLLRQLGAALGVGAALKAVPAAAWERIVVAYEPVWATGEGSCVCSPEEAQRVHASLRGWVRDNASEEAARACRFVYAGIIDANNAAEYARLPDVDGFVIGRPGLESEKLMSICTELVDCKDVLSKQEAASAAAEANNATNHPTSP